MEERMARIEGIMEQMNKRLNHIETEISELRGEISSNFRWTLGLLIPMWVSIIATILFSRWG